MQHTLQFLSVSQTQVHAVLQILAKEDGVVPVGDSDPTLLNGSLKGKTPLGEVTGTYDYSPASGQLTVVITEKPALLTVDTIKMKIREAIDGAAVPQAEPVSETPVPAAIPITPPPATVPASTETKPQTTPSTPAAPVVASAGTPVETGEGKTETSAEPAS